MKKGDATVFLAAIETDVARGQWRDPALGRTLLSDWISKWSATTTNLRPSTRARDDSYIRNHIVPAFGSSELAGITQLDVRAWVADLDGKGLRQRQSRSRIRSSGRLEEMFDAIPKDVSSAANVVPLRP